MCNQTSEWALKQATEAEEASDLFKADKYQKIAELSINEDTPMEIPVGGTGFFVKAERQGAHILM